MGLNKENLWLPLAVFCQLRAIKSPTYGTKSLIFQFNALVRLKKYRLRLWWKNLVNSYQKLWFWLWRGTKFKKISKRFGHLGIQRRKNGTGRSEFEHSSTSSKFSIRPMMTEIEVLVVWWLRPLIWVSTFISNEKLCSAFLENQKSNAETEDDKVSVAPASKCSNFFIKHFEKKSSSSNGHIRFRRWDLSKLLANFSWNQVFRKSNRMRGTESKQFQPNSSLKV